MTKVVNFFAGPSAGKTTLGLQLAGYMKEKRYNVAYVPEFATELVWSQRFADMDDQLYVTAEQNHRLYRLVGQADWVVTDSPILMGIHYARQGQKKFTRGGTSAWAHWFEQLVLETFHQYDNVNFFVDRKDRKFIQAGRIHDEEKSIVVDSYILQILNGFDYERVSTLTEVVTKLGV